ncbi:Pectinesterase inhibitor domain containing protein [Trema orientale]|uniref:Pectinesterase inhibitor domain containing protein n=1 Tax=Trema orientale TaxID=63057 RepID=A0A2P5BI35_TREOI|nr:Pectinesterase inhibitor domain containing protein [Trema orientale]
MGFPFSSLYIVMFIFSSLQNCSLGSNFIQQSCKKAVKTDPNLRYDFCITTLEANPKTRKAKHLEELAIISIELTISNATEIASNISNLLRQKTEVVIDPYAKGCLKDCSELYSDAISALRDAKLDIESNDFEKANVDISSAMDASSTCEDGFKEKKGEVSPLTKENSVFFQWTVISLAFTNMLVQQ